MTRKDIRELMKLMGWSQAEFSRQVDADESTISRWLSGAVKPTGPTQVLLRNLLDEARAAKREPAGVPA